MSTAIAACTMEVDDTEFVQQPQQMFIRPVHWHMDFLDVQDELPHGSNVLYLEQFRVSKDVVARVSVRSQVQFFQDHNHVTLAYYRQLGERAITKGLVDGGFYGSDPYEPDRVRSSCEAFRPQVSWCVMSVSWEDSSLSLRVVKAAHLTALYTARRSLKEAYLAVTFTLVMLANTDGRPKTAKECCNYRHSKARIVVERAFGVPKIKWKVLSSNLRLQLEYSIDVFALHYTICVLPAIHGTLMTFRTLWCGRTKMTSLICIKTHSKQ
ncbi:hypothetical protein H257_16151 [Aphanomyces astaci]|uniref:DDE Tnp4 domain-containing protein n=1 Tax=Aphanomyces astaci TaxID=112090 RepID=W4FJM8_APHAT|nr:hypothetical protein H257_16151 [Aphanomyces astaci]ETV67680.1 hypothetical protein H257_16151 [Aphanomyces astaci]|eukprot:XP_009842801.1 hypothetical protein H257_16151 [Aphanomyces astaci]